MTVWKLQTKDYPETDPGLVSGLYGFNDSPDAEVFARGTAGKGPDTVPLGRHANFFLWGFSAPPADMTPAAKRLFVNAVCYVPVKRQLLEIVCLNFCLDGASLVVEMRKPFDVLAEGLLVLFSRGDSCCTIVNETPGLGLVLGLLPNSYEFSGEQLAPFIQPGLYSKQGLNGKPLE
jgi:hypothetical protein